MQITWERKVRLTFVRLRSAKLNALSARSAYVFRVFPTFRM